MRAPQPEPPIPGSFATPSLLAWIVNGKYVMSLPLYRIEADLKACGATISRQDMANWMMNVHARWLAKVHERMKVELLSHVRIHADETTVQVLKEPNREAKKKYNIQRHHHGQGQRAQSQALRRVAADRDAQRRRAHR